MVSAPGNISTTCADRTVAAPDGRAAIVVVAALGCHEALAEWRRNWWPLL